ncbi:hypothetical protein HA50_14500 [Pantoea cypripedii]|uniref:Uncharacterized protein n=1 Tax=Pantoea cypripedii TaxID=55209 RepID=A0A1X1EWT8_PANCY|nr:hypothetical protein HA50_14500 [Pantoea cypripedii]
MQSGFPVGVLSGVAQRLMMQRRQPGQAVKAFRLPADLAKAAVLPAPAHRALCIRHLQRRTVQVRAEPEYLSLRGILLMVDSRQRAPGFCRVINIGLAAAVRLLPGV